MNTTRFKQNRRLRWLLVFGWMGVIFLLSHQPKATLAPAQPSVFLSAENVDWSLFWQFTLHIDWDTVAGKSAHVMVYGLLAWLLWRARPVARFVLFSAVGYGVLDEIHQLFIPGRTGKMTDVLFDGLGALLVVLWVVWSRGRNKPFHTIAPQA